MRVTVRRTEERPPDSAEGASLAIVEEEPLPPVEPQNAGLIRIEAPMVGTFYRASQPGAPPFVEEGDAVAAARRSASSRR